MFINSSMLRHFDIQSQRQSGNYAEDTIYIYIYITRLQR